MIRRVLLLNVLLIGSSLFVQVERYAPDQQGVSKTFSKLADAELRRELANGGYILVFRHSITDWSFKEDATKVVVADRMTQRNLSAKGIEQAKAIGETLKKLGIRFDAIHSSYMFRTIESAEHLAGKSMTHECLVMFDKRNLELARTMFGKLPATGFCTLIVTHGSSIEKIFTQFKQNEVEEGNCVVIRPLGGATFEVIAHLSLKDWQRLTY